MERAVILASKYLKVLRVGDVVMGSEANRDKTGKYFRWVRCQADRIYQWFA